jgi:hypothetical protein
VEEETLLFEEEIVGDEAQLDLNDVIYTTANSKEFAQRQIMGEHPEEILQSFRERKEATLDQVKDTTEISWIKSIGECEAFIMASMFQQHVNLTRTQSILLQHWNDSVLGNMNVELLNEIRENYDYVSSLVDAHEKKMDSFKDACRTRREGK